MSEQTKPKALPYSPIRKVGELLFTAGQVGRDPETLIIENGIEAQTKKCMENLDFHLKNNGSSLAKVVKFVVYLTDMSNYAAMNEIYASYLNEPYPARTCIAVKELPRLGDIDLVVEIEAIATI
ncbi:MAG: RidA family protein [Acidimicrobiia bacterium]|nr:RidA family protein [Acidimicrobiia bacterium]